ncbi:MAG: 4-hydroxy-3-methylbut-2-enyl diphosphate reductase [Bacteroidia bacterium]|nr:4-hydroxy-3-methylbut-2-enyl diphosphate reductase [Bacteroidia bacterium]
MGKYQSRNFKKQYDLGQYAPLYQNNLFSVLKNQTPPQDRMSPFELNFGPVTFLVARHFGFCKGVENAIEVAYETLANNPGRRVFMISELIHNSYVNADLHTRGLRFIKTAQGQQLIPWDELLPEDIVITPAFGATLEDQAELQKLGVNLNRYNATCRFVENVWFRAAELGTQGYTIIVHGKFRHEETLATLSHSQVNAPTVVVKDMEEARILAGIIGGTVPESVFFEVFGGKCSAGFQPARDLNRVAVVNQTTMLATETADIADYFRQVMTERFGSQDIEYRIANTRDTLCYATKNNQSATLRLLEEQADLAIVIGGRNSSNTSHLVELCEQQLATYFIASEFDIITSREIRHFDIHRNEERVIFDFVNYEKPTKILLTSGASCPDAIVERVLLRLLSFFEGVRPVQEVIRQYAVMV